MARILVTGATGFIGGSLAQAFLNEVHEVICLSRNDDEGMRTRSNISQCASGFGTRLSPAQWAKLSVIPFNLWERDLTEVESSFLSTADFVWHCAAEMSFSTRKSVDSFESNQGGTLRLYENLSKHCPKLSRFFYVSTAFTSGFHDGPISEKLHLVPRFNNPYQISKWGTEMALREHVSANHSVPVTVFRPGIVTGHGTTGWYGGKCFGLYMFLDGWSFGVSLGATQMRIDVNPEGGQPFVTIDEITENALRITNKELPHDEFDILHCTGSLVPNLMTTEVAGRLMGFRSSFGKPQTATDFIVDRFVSPNKSFAAGYEFDFEQKRLGELLGTNHFRCVIDEERMLLLMTRYISEQTKLDNILTGNLPRKIAASYTELNRRGLGRLIHIEGHQRIANIFLGKVLLPGLKQRSKKGA